MEFSLDDQLLTSREELCLLDIVKELRSSFLLFIKRCGANCKYLDRKAIRI
jgi:hypothetical protein